MVAVLNLALPYFGLIFIGYACGKAKGLPEQGLAWMNFFLLYVSLPALMFVITSKTPFEELNNPPFLGVVEFRIDIENHAPERKYPVTDDLPDLKFGGPRFYHISSNRP